MKKTIITIYELIGLIKDGKAPKKIKYDDIIWEYSNVDYNYRSTTCVLNYEYILNILKILNDTVEILPEENEEWEDIELLMCLDTRETTDCICKIQDKINKLIKNQKYLKERLDKNE